MASAVQLLPSYRSRYLWLDRERGPVPGPPVRVHQSRDFRRREAAGSASLVDRTWTRIGDPGQGRFHRPDRDRSGADLQSGRGREGERLLQYLPSPRRDASAASRAETASASSAPITAGHTGARASCSISTPDYGYGERFNEDGFYDLLACAEHRQRAGSTSSISIPDAIPLDDYLADAGPMLDAIADQSAVGMEVVRGCHEYEIKANYKLIWREQLRRLPPRPDALELRRLHDARWCRASRLGDEHPWRARSLGNGHACFELRDSDGPAGGAVAAGVGRRGEDRDRSQEDASSETRPGKARADRIASDQSEHGHLSELDHQRSADQCCCAR